MFYRDTISSSSCFYRNTNRTCPIVTQSFLYCDTTSSCCDASVSYREYRNHLSVLRQLDPVEIPACSIVTQSSIITQPDPVEIPACSIVTQSSIITQPDPVEIPACSTVTQSSIMTQPDPVVIPAFPITTVVFCRDTVEYVPTVTCPSLPHYPLQQTTAVWGGVGGWGGRGWGGGGGSGRVLHFTLAAVL